MADPSGSQPKSILVVDDSPTVLAMAEHVLGEAGYRVVTSDNPILVPATIWRERPDLVLLDVQMPGLAGDWVQRLLRDEGCPEGTKVCFYSSEKEAVLVDLVERTGAAGYLHKTDEPQDLLDAVREWIGGPTAT